MNRKIWHPSANRVRKSRVLSFIKNLEEDIDDFQELHEFSINFPDKFWGAAWDFFEIIGQKGDTIYQPHEIFYKSSYFPNAKINFAQNMIKHKGSDEAIVFWGENKDRRAFTFDDVNKKSIAFAKSLLDCGILAGDRVAAYVPNIPEVIISMIGASAVGAIWSSCSPDFGINGVLDRFSQIEPKVLITTDGYMYGGKYHCNLEKLPQILEGLPSVEKVIVIPFFQEAKDMPENAILFNDFIANQDTSNFIFELFPFDHPLYILFSSGTTGKPKCIVHGAGRVLLQHLKEHQLHSDIQKKDRVFYFSTCGWMMWNWQASALASGATLILYDGSPFAYKGKILLDLASSERVTFFGVSAKYIDALSKTSIIPNSLYEFESLRTIASTGSPLSPEGFDFIYSSFKSDVQLASISGGTDLVGCFVLGNPIGPVYRGEIQSSGLGMMVDVLNDQGVSVIEEKGELVCKNPFMSQPIYFWNDKDDVKRIETYFSKYQGIWHHGDYVEKTCNGGFIIHGRSDTTLNPGGVRIGTAEIYRQVEKVEEVFESLVIGQEYQNDVRVILFVKLKEGILLCDNLIDKIKHEIRENATPRHVPAKVIQVPDIPKTKSGKITEIAVRDLIHGKKINNVEAILNPESLIFYEQLVID